MSEGAVALKYMELMAELEKTPQPIQVHVRVKSSDGIEASHTVDFSPGFSSANSSNMQETTKHQAGKAAMLCLKEIAYIRLKEKE